MLHILTKKKEKKKEKNNLLSQLIFKMWIMGKVHNKIVNDKSEHVFVYFYGYIPSRICEDKISKMSRIDV